jgi:hypothetical protein
MQVTDHSRRWLITTALAACLTLGGAVWGQASTEALDTQLATAIQHSGFSMEAEAHDMAVRHLGHVLNCLAGEGGEGFDASWGHPCGGQGDGIVADLASHPHHDDVAALIRSAHALAMEGVQSASLGGVRAAAAGVQALLMVVADFGG